MRQSSQYATRAFTVPAGGSVEIVRTSTFLTVLEAGGPLKVKFDNGPKSDIEQGLTVRMLQEFQRVEVINPGAGDVSVKLGFGRGDVRDARLTIAGTVATKEAVHSGFEGNSQVNIGAGVNGVIYSPDPSTRVVGMKNTGETRLWVQGTNNVGPAGHPLDPGETLIIPTSGDVRAYNEGAVAGTVARWRVQE